jgi:two-component system chemotaxis sensor kinase CheA
MQASADFLKKLTATFLIEAREHVLALGSSLIELEKAGNRDAQLPLVETLFREAHSLKGAARAVNAGAIERACQEIEGTFAGLKSGQSTLSPAALDGLHQAVTAVGRMIDALEAGPPGAEGAGPGAVVASPMPPTPPAMRNENANTVRIVTTKLDAIFVQAEELRGVRLDQAERGLELRSLAGMVTDHDRLWVETMPLMRSLRQQVDAGADAPGLGEGTDAGSLALPARLLELLDRGREQAEAISTRVTDLTRSIANDQRRLDAVAGCLLEEIKKALMLPFENILAGFPKMVRDMAHEAGKEIEFQLRGAGIEIDKRILEQIKDPLVHLIRNSVDHGIEPTAERLRRNKPVPAIVSLVITQTGGRVEITVTDDGAGIDLAAVKAAAVESGLIAAGEAAALGEHEVRQMVFRSGLTTSRQVTAVSGRGLGMAIVEDRVTNLGGTVGIESKAGAGTTVRLGLPSTLATLRGTLVRAVNRDFVVPTANVIRVIRVPRASIRRVENRDSINLDGTTLALVWLADVLGLVSGPITVENAAPLTALVLGQGQLSMAFVVDRVVGEQEVLAKPLGRLLPRVRNLAGATVLGTGRVVPILNTADLLQTAAGCTPATSSVAAAATIQANRLLVVDDSITVRTLLQNILESSGYSVRTAPDGAAAFDALQTGSFDLVISDIEMPRMDGFELTKRIRGQPALAELPVVLVTARETKDDRERGLEAGANAYIVKSSFDQSDLLAVIGKLI